MQFSTAPFLMIFLPIVIIVYKIGGGGHQLYKNIVLLLASLFFYAWGEPLFVFILLLGICINFIFGEKIENTKGKYRKILLLFDMAINVGLLIIFKYLTFITENISMLLGTNIINIALPIGVSFYTFQIMSYIFDVYYEKVPAQNNILNLALYISMFPQLVAGPIVRYSLVEKEIRIREDSYQDFSDGLSRFTIGLAKKVLLADFLGGIADKIFVTAEFSSVTSITAWIGAIAYSFEIYYDFSGYSDMAIGLGNIFGFHFQENFNYPYISRSITEFWKRWHISLTDWFRDYVYIPLGGNRVSGYRHVWNLFVVWSLTGIWHGAEWTFIIWGFYYFILQLIEKKIGIIKKELSFIGYGTTAILVILGWVLFRASNIESAIHYFQCMFGGFSLDTVSVQYIKSVFVVFVISYIGTFPIFPLFKDKVLHLGNHYGEIIWKIFDLTWTSVLFLTSLAMIINGSYSPFIYFNF